MSGSSTCTTFQKRRRTYVACLTCRKRKIKARICLCVTFSDADSRPCTRCAQRGIPCEYAPVQSANGDSGTSSPEPQAPPCASVWTDNSEHGIVPPCAEIAGHVNHWSRGSTRSLAPRPQPYPRPYRPNVGTTGETELPRARPPPPFISNQAWMPSPPFVDDVTGQPHPSDARVSHSRGPGLPPNDCLCPPGLCYCDFDFDNFAALLLPVDSSV
ncbi:hypothetical protein B0H17DRAFT_1220235 [Mycena rosella]|uniref:Zn(2)-C6 fungal-type domain-containing protein n=1 Tax=Mycena rosella TaxID=1033263 RepID=A0AAD7BCG1_MYCRO|nr:hypothetical protein B0H17DRAFT_1220235 [Mycena rosella]